MAGTWQEIAWQQMLIEQVPSPSNMQVNHSIVSRRAVVAREWSVRVLRTSVGLGAVYGDLASGPGASGSGGCEPAALAACGAAQAAAVGCSQGLCIGTSPGGLTLQCTTHQLSLLTLDTIALL